MVNTGNLLKEYEEYLIELFTTKQGLFSFFISTAIWGFLILKYNQAIFNYISNMLKFIEIAPLNFYLSYLGLGIVYSLIGLGLTTLIMKIYSLVFKNG